MIIMISYYDYMQCLNKFNSGVYKINTHDQVLIIYNYNKDVYIS